MFLHYIYSDTGRMTYAEYERRILQQKILTEPRLGTAITIVATEADYQQTVKEKDVLSVYRISEYMRFVRCSGMVTCSMTGGLTKLYDETPKANAATKGFVDCDWDELSPKATEQTAKKRKGNDRTDTVRIEGRQLELSFLEGKQDVDWYDVPTDNGLAFNASSTGQGDDEPLLTLKMDLTSLYPELKKGFRFNTLYIVPDEFRVSIVVEGHSGKGIPDKDYEIEIVSCEIAAKKPSPVDG